MAALILAMRLTSFSLELSREILLLGVWVGDAPRLELGADVLLEVEAGALLPLAAEDSAAWLLEPLTLRKTSIAIAVLSDPLYPRFVPPFAVLAASQSEREQYCRVGCEDESKMNEALALMAALACVRLSFNESGRLCCAGDREIP